MYSLKICSFLLVLFFLNMVKASETDHYDFLWLDPDKAVYVLQNKVFEKKGSFFADISYLQNGSSEFQNSTGFNLSAGYFFHEEWAVQTFFTTYSNSDNSSFLNVTQINGSEPFVRRSAMLLGGGVLWSPFYGKINTFNKIFYFDLSFGMGVAQISTEESDVDTLLDPLVTTEYFPKTYSALQVETALKVYINKTINVHFKISDSIYKAPGPRDVNDKKIRHSVDTMIGIGFSF